MLFALDHANVHAPPFEFPFIGSCTQDIKFVVGVCERLINYKIVLLCAVGK